MASILSTFWSTINPDFIVYSHTGDRRNTIVDAHVLITLYDDKGNSSSSITLDNKFRNDFERGQVDTFKLNTDDTKNLDKFGKIVRIELWKKHDHGFLGNDWFVDKIVVENQATGIYFQFPIFRWIKTEYKYQVVCLDTSLPQSDQYPDQRKMELEEKREMYQYEQKSPGGPTQVKDLPDDENFSFDYKFDIGVSVVKMKAVIGHTVLHADKWEQIDQILSFYKGKVFEKPKGADGWNEDYNFGLQRLAGVNHSVITLVTSIPDKLPVTDKLLGPLLEGLTLDQAVKQKKLFLCDLHMLEGIPTKEGCVVCAPIGLFYLNKIEELKPVAIQLYQKPGPDNPIFTPNNPPRVWSLAKMWYNNADSQYHQPLTHLGFTHLLMEGCCVAANRNLSQSHPIYKLLAPHFLYLLAIDKLAVTSLAAPGGWIDKTMNNGHDGTFALLERGFKTWRMDVDGILPEDLKRRGVDEAKILPNYYFRDDAILLYNAISKYVKAYVELYYPNPDLLKKDWEVQGWARDLVKERNNEEGGLGLLGVPGNGQLTTNEELAQILTCIIFTCSVSHAAANFPQYDEYGFPPNYPASMSGNPPTDPNADITEQDLLDALPGQEMTADIMVIMQLLSTKGTKSLGDFEVQYIFDPPALEIVAKLREDLAEISRTIKERNKHRKVPYDYLDPEVVPNAISI